MKDYQTFIPLLGAKVDPEEYGVYPFSINMIEGGAVFMAKEEDHDIIVTVGDDYGFSGLEFETEGCRCTAAPLTHGNAENLRKLFPFTAPIKVLGKERTMGVGDRLGIAGFGHIRVFQEFDIFPILAQQSIRELNLTQRTYKDVLDSATFAVFREGYRKGFGADGDHLKKVEEVKMALDLGFTMITLDCSEHMRNDAEQLPLDEVEAKHPLEAKLRDRYLNKSFQLEDGIVLTFDHESLVRMAAVYHGVLDSASSIYEAFFKDGTYVADFEISIDETTTPTTPLQHFFVANELRERGVSFATIAPRFCGEFQKGVDYIGDLKQFEEELIVHCAIARHFGYKLSLHSGSDKFSVFTAFGKHTHGRFHVKTAGTNWLEAMKLIAMVDPKLYREIHAFALSKFSEVTKYYHVSTDLSRIPNLASLPDKELVNLFDNNDARQLIHITYGPILSTKTPSGDYVFKDKLYGIWRQQEQLYSEMLYRHIGKHVKLLCKEVKTNY
ncbi:MAG: tagaturonate epimerase family protein [Sphaerochaetaceae bacterium]|nr:tagaturonate epimerase family protein [Sphaerochaetaceae bacterium]